MGDLRDKARILLELHHGDRILVLPNAWDAGSAKIFAAAGFPAIATTSAGIAFAHGLPDGQRISAGEMLGIVRQIAGAVTVPVTADVEAGYGDIAATVRGVVEAGAVGMNLEDSDGVSLVPLAEQVERIRAARSASGIPVVLNARTDVFWLKSGGLADAVERMRAYTEAGADCLFVPGVTDEAVIRELVHAAPKPLNLLATAALPPVSRLRELGVARVSTGSGPARAALSVAQGVAEELLSTGGYTSFTGCSLTYAAANQLFEK